MAVRGESSPEERMDQVMAAIEDGLDSTPLDSDAAAYARRGCTPELAKLSDADWQDSSGEIMEVAKAVGEAAAADAEERELVSVDLATLRSTSIGVISQRPTPLCRFILDWLQGN